MKEPLPDDLNDLGQIDALLFQLRENLSEKHDKPDRPYDYYSDLREEWEEDDHDGEEDTLIDGKDKDSTHITRIISLLSKTRNVILYGPPGTGKTYFANKAADAIVEEQKEQPLSESARQQRVVEELSTFEVLALALYRAGDSALFSVPNMMKLQIVDIYFRMKPIKHPHNNIWGHLQAHTSPESLTVSYSDRRPPFLFDKNEKSQWFLTDEGYNYVTENLKLHLERLHSSVTEEKDFVTWTTFHQSYAYEDFVEGLRPVQREDSSDEISYEVVPGVFRKICARAAEDKDNKYVLIIDEINRGNIAKIFGELITLLEDDKRKGGDNALEITLPYSQDHFMVPSNIYIIGTMNTADRSIALLDIALRRRFAFYELMPQPSLLKGDEVESDEAVVSLEKLLRVINNNIREYLDRDHQIGHSYFMQVTQENVEDPVGTLEFVWNNEVIPLLEEYFYSQRDKLEEILAPMFPEEEQEFAIEGETPIQRLTGDDLIDSLARLAEQHED